MGELDIPIVQTLRSGREVVVGLASNMAGAESLLDQLTARSPRKSYYIDCARTPDEVREEQAELDRAATLRTGVIES